MAAAVFDEKYRKVFDDESGAVLDLLCKMTDEKISRINTKLNDYKQEMLSAFNSHLITPITDENVLHRIIDCIVEDRKPSEEEKKFFAKLQIRDEFVFRAFAEPLDLLHGELYVIREEYNLIESLRKDLPCLFLNISGTPTTNRTPLSEQAVGGSHTNILYVEGPFDNLAVWWNFDHLFNSKSL